MCGFAACFSSTKRVTDEMLQSATRVLKHRGPDGQRHWINGARRAGVAHARLSLLDLSTTGDQPLLRLGHGTHASQAGVRGPETARLALVHNGEFYDFERVKKELEGAGHEFQTKTDSEILLPLYDDFGTAALAKLRGEFAFVLWDERQKQVFAARDRFGIKPLFYAYHDGALYMASEVKALFAMGVPRLWDAETVHDFHQTWLLPTQRTLYKNVFQLPPGHFLIASEGSQFAAPVVASYWDFDYPRGDEPAPTGAALEREVVALRERFEEAVRLRLRADVPVACYLSGGLDSCAVLGAAAKQSKDPVHAFTLAFPDEAAYDESDVAREMAAHAGAIYHEIPVRWAELAANFEDAVWHGEVPIANTHVVAKYLLSGAVRQAGFKAVLTGEGSDEIFGGYVHFRKDVLLGQGGADTKERLAALAKNNVVSSPLMLADQPESLAGVAKVLGYVPSFLMAHGLAGERTSQLLRPDFHHHYSGQDSWRKFTQQFDVPRQLWGRSTLNQSLYLWSKTMLPSYLLTVLGDRMEMAHSIEGRLPFLDHELVEHVVRLPVGLKIQQDLTEKFLLREAAKPFLTKTVYQRQKHPFLAPPAAASPGSALFSFVQDVFRSQRFKESPFYDQKKVLLLLDQIPTMTREMQAGCDGLLMSILSFVTLEDRLGLTAG